ncbi:MAG: hypothetical protein WBV73_04990 [Phormidium sp.]
MIISQYTILVSTIGKLDEPALPRYEFGYRYLLSSSVISRYIQALSLRDKPSLALFILPQIQFPQRRHQVLNFVQMLQT